MEFGVPFFVGLTICILMFVANELIDFGAEKKRNNPNCIHCMKKVSKLATTCPYCNKHPWVKESVRVIDSQNTTCVNCKKSVNYLATICPYCRKNPKRIGFIQ